MTPHTPTPQVTGEDGFLTLNGLRFHTVSWGDPALPALVCLHGLRSYARTFEPLALALADRFRVIALDQRGRGDTDWDPARNYRAEQYVADLEALVDRLEFPSFHLLGHSMGGINALVYGLRHPHRLDSLVLEDSGPGASSDSDGADRIRRELQSTPMRFDDWAQARAFWRRIRPNVTEAAIDSRVINSMKPGDPATGAGVVWKHDQAGIADIWSDPARVTPDLWPCVKALRCPTLVVRGGRSDYLSPATLAAMRDANPQVRGVEIPDAGHYVHDDQPERFIAAVHAFLVDGPGSPTATTR